MSASRFIPALLLPTLLAGTPGSAQSPSPHPELTISANRAADLEVPRGWPILVSGRLFHSERLNRSEEVAPLEIAPTGMSWPEAIDIVVTAADGTEMQWGFKLDGRAETPALTLPHRSHIVVGWVLKPEQTLALANGRYRLSAKLALSGTTGWNGEVESTAVTVTIIDEPAVLDEELATRKATLSAEVEITERRLEQAAAVIDDLLARYPKSAQGLYFRSRILELQGRVPEAWVAASEALQAFDEVNPDPREPPFTLLNHERALFARLDLVAQRAPSTTRVSPAPAEAPVVASSSAAAAPGSAAGAAPAGGGAADASGGGAATQGAAAGASAGGAAPTDAGAAGAASGAGAAAQGAAAGAGAGASAGGAAPTDAGAAGAASGAGAAAQGAAGAGAGTSAGGAAPTDAGAAGATSGTAALLVTPAGAAPAGSTITVGWSGPNGTGDYITIVRKGALPYEYLSYQYTSRGNPVSITLPPEPGAYEIRYVSERPKSVLATVPYETTAVSATLDVPRTGVAGSTVAVKWTGPNYARDWIAVASPDAFAGAYADYFYTNGGDGTLDLPVEPGTYEFRYVQDGPKVLARSPIEVVAAAAEITAPASVAAGAPFEVSWTGPNNRGDWLTIVAPTAAPNAYGSYADTDRGGPVTLRAPAQAGRYELRYVLKGRKVVATSTIEVVAAAPR